MFGLIKKMFIGLLTGVVNGISVSNQKCITQPTLINPYPNKLIHKFHYHPFAVKLDRRVGSCNNMNDLSNKVCVANKTED